MYPLFLGSRYKWCICSSFFTSYFPRSEWQSLGPSLLLQISSFSSFCSWAVFYIHCILFLYAFICQWTFRLFSHPGHREQWCSQHWGACIFLMTAFLEYMRRSGIAESCGSFIFSFLGGRPHCSPSWLYQLTLPQQCRRFPLSPAFIVCTFCNGGLYGLFLRKENSDYFSWVTHITHS